MSEIPAAPYTVSDDEGDTRESTPPNAIRPPSPTTGDPVDRGVGDVSSAASADEFDNLRREFLFETARSLSLSRVRSAKELKVLVDSLGHALSRLCDLRLAIERVCELHAALDCAVAQELSSAAATAVRYAFDAADADPNAGYATSVDAVVDMFMRSIRSEEAESTTDQDL